MSKRIAYGSNLIGVDSGGGGSSYTAGDGIDITNNAISVDTEFTEAQTRANIASGETVATILGKIKKWFTDLPNMFVSKQNGGTFGGDIIINRSDGTASEEGTSTLNVGNNTPSGTDGNSYGQVRIYGKGSYYSVIDSGTQTATRRIHLPDKSGTVFLQEGGTFTDNIAVDRGDSSVSTARVSQIALGNNIASGTAGNSFGQIALWDRGNHYSVLATQDNNTGDRTIRLPDKDGTLATTDDLSTYSSDTDISSLTGATVRLSRYGNVVTLWFSVPKNTITTSGAWTQIGLVPSGLRPPRTIDFLAINNDAQQSSALPVQCRISSSNGYLTIWAFATNVPYLGHITYIC